MKTFFKRPAIFVFLLHTENFLGRGQWRNQGEGAERASALLAKSLRSFNHKIQSFKYVLDLT